MSASLPRQLRQLEAESIAILREAAGAFRNPVLLYSVGKDSGVMLHLALKAFRPGRLPFPLLHVATTWDFAEMIRHRDRMVAEHGLRLIVHTNEAALAAGATPLGPETREYTRLMLTEALKAALDADGFDAAFGGGRRDEERSRAKERVFSVRAPGHAWEPRDQRPELWSLFNTRLSAGQTMRVFPLSNWTELDIWNYIRLEGVPLVPLYLARERPVVRRRGAMIVVDDDRLPLLPGEVPEQRRVRFRTLGCYPLSGAIESAADTVEAIYAETLSSTLSERQGRLIDGDEQAAMERKKREGYF